MKELKDYVCTFEQSIKLEKLGVKQDSFYYWGKVVNKNLKTSFYVIKERDRSADGKYWRKGGYAAFLYQEIEEIIYNIFGELDFNCEHLEDGIISFFYDQEYFEAKNHCQAMAEFLIYLLQQQKLEKKNENETN